MNNKDIHIGIVGAGRIGTAIYELLISSNLYKVSIADHKEQKLHHDNYVQLKVTKPIYDGENTQFKEFVNDKPNRDKIEPGKKEFDDINNYIKRGVLWDAFVAEKKPVLLIDEVDKADIEFPNDLLLELDKMEFYVWV